MLAEVKKKNRNIFTKGYIILSLIVITLLSLLVSSYINRIGLPFDRTWDKTTVAEYVQKIALTPQGETPVIAQVVDPTNLISQNPNFFKGAQKDDYVLVYTTKALIFRPLERKIINMIILDTNNKVSV